MFSGYRTSLSLLTVQFRVMLPLLFILAIQTNAFESAQRPLIPDSAQLSSSSSNVKEVDYYGIGFDFSTNYATAAISYPNGTNLGLVKISGNDEYQHLFYSLSRPESRHRAPPYNDVGDSWDDIPRQTWRRFLKRIGLPASTEARIIGEMIKKLRVGVEAKLGHSVTHAVASFPLLTALYLEDVVDAFIWAGLKHQLMDSFDKPTADVSVAYAAHGFQMCEHYKDQVQCKKEQDAMFDWGKPWEMSDINLHFLLNTDVLMVTISQQYTPYSYFQFSDTIYQSFDLGFDAMPFIPEYWTRVHHEMSKLVSQKLWVFQMWRHKKIFVYGEKASEDQFLRAIEKVGEQIHVNETDKIEFFLHDEDEFMLAKGSAELAKRDLYGYPAFSWDK